MRYDNQMPSSVSELPCMSRIYNLIAGLDVPKETKNVLHYFMRYHDTIQKSEYLHEFMKLEGSDAVREKLEEAQEKKRTRPDCAIVYDRIIKDYMIELMLTENPEFCEEMIKLYKNKVIDQFLDI